MTQANWIHILFVYRGNFIQKKKLNRVTHSKVTSTQSLHILQASISKKMKTIQVGDTCYVIKRFLHSSRIISDRYPNQEHREALEGLLVTGINEQRLINRSMKQVRRPLYCVPRYMHVTNGNREPVIPIQEDAAAEDLIEMPEVTGNNQEDMERLCIDGYNVDDDNEPAPENVPDNNQNNNTGFDPTWVQYHDWNSNVFCNWKVQFNHFENASIKPNQSPLGNKQVDWFLRCIPMRYIQDVLIPEMNKKLIRRMDLPEFLRFLGLLFLMSTTRVGCGIQSYQDQGLKKFCTR